MSTTLISLVGTQVMGTLQPWLALHAEEPDLEVYLLPTKKVQKQAQQLKDFAAPRNLGTVHVQNISNGSSGPESCVEAVQVLAQAAQSEGRRVVFNLDGGMNFMICACVLALRPYNAATIQASAWRVVLTEGDTARTLPMPAPLSAAELLQLQNTDYSQEPLTSWNVPNFCKKGNIALPNGALCGVRINDVLFDVVWNAGNNRMHFLVNSMYLPEDFERSREADRSLAHWAANRERSAQIYDREVIALVQSDESAERLRNESSGKVNVQNVNGWKADATILRDVLIKLFGRTIPKAGNLPAPKAAQRAPMQDNTLITCVGTNIMSTLLAITSHKPAHVVLCYTERVPAVAEYAQRLQKLAPELGMTASLVPISIEGLFLDALLPVPEEKARVLVNISPGTKGQGAMLSLWAERHNAAVWSINRAAQQIDPLYAPHGETAQPLFMSDPVLYLQVCGERLHDAGADMDALAPDLPLMDGLLAFMRAALDEGKDAAVLRKSVRAGGMELCPAGGKNSKQWELRREGNVFPFTFAGGEWFEKLAAVAFSRAGAHVVRQRVRLDWCETTREAIIQRHTDTKEEEVFRVDMDVVGAWGPDIFLVSCKSNPYTPQEAPAVEALHVGSTLGRFALRLLAHLGCSTPELRQDGVMVIGWRELCRPEALRTKMDELRRKHSTTEN